MAFSTDSPTGSRPGSRFGCLLIHGYGGTPFEMEGIARALTAEGITVSLPTLPGHGFGHEPGCEPGHGNGKGDFASFRFDDWLSFVENELALLRAKCDKVAIVGGSMGGTLALNLASRFPVAGIAVISTPLYVLHVSPWPLRHAVFYASSGLEQLSRLLGGGKKGEGEARETSRSIAPWKGYAGPLNLAQLYSFRKGCITTRKLLPGLTAPLLVMHDANDRIVYSGNACEIARRVASSSITVRFTRISETITRHHMIVTHRETESFVTETVTKFCLSCGG